MSTSSQSTATTGESALRAVPVGASEAWARADADAFAEAFTPATNVVIAGTYLLGRDAVRSYVAAAFSGPFRGTRLISDPVYFKRLGSDFALIVTKGGVLLPGESTVAPLHATRGTWLLARTDAGWQIDAYHSSPMRAD
jgi:uncharacterized protein (TIGR02246 family)